MPEEFRLGSESEAPKLTQINVLEDEQGGSFIEPPDTGYAAEDFLQMPQPDFDVFTNLDSRIEDYQITKEGNGTIQIKIGTTYSKGGPRATPINRQTSEFSSEEESKTHGNKSVADQIELHAKLQEDKPKVPGKKYNFEVAIDPTSESGFKMLPKHVEAHILTAFKKDEIIADPERVL